MRFVTKTVAVLAVGALGVGSATALADSDDGNRQAIDTGAGYTPFEEFTPIASPVPCSAAGTGPEADPLVLPTPPSHDQVVVEEEGEGGTNDLWDMNTQNEFGKDAGRYVYRTHEVGQSL